MACWFKRTMMVIAGLCWLGAAVACGGLLLRYLTAGTEMQPLVFLGVSSTSVFIGLVHVVGFAAATSLGFVIGIGLCAYGIAPPEKHDRQ